MSQFITPMSYENRALFSELLYHRISKMGIFLDHDLDRVMSRFYLNPEHNVYFYVVVYAYDISFGYSSPLDKGVYDHPLCPQQFTSQKVFESIEPSRQEKFLWHLDLINYFIEGDITSFDFVDELTRYLDDC